MEVASRDSTDRIEKLSQKLIEDLNELSGLSLCK